MQQGQQLAIPPHSEDVEEELRRITIALESVFNRNNNNNNNNIPISGNEINNLLLKPEIANEFLTSFQRIPIAWMVCDKILLLEDVLDLAKQEQFRFFAAQTLHFKCRDEVYMNQIPVDALPSLRDSLLAHLFKYSSNNPTSNRPLVTRLCMTLSALAAQMGWNTIIPDILSNFKEELMLCILELFQILPEEACSPRLYAVQRSDFIVGLKNHTDNLVAFLNHCFQQGQTQLVLQCITTWLKYIDIPVTLLQSSLILDGAFASLSTYSEVFESAVDMIVEVLRSYGSLVTANAGLIEKLVPMIMNISTNKAFQQALQNSIEEEDLLRGYCRIFTEMGESYLDLILSPRELNQKAILDLILQCSAISNKDIATITLHFWYKFVHEIEATEPMEFRQHCIDYYTECITNLLSVCAILLAYPEDVLDLTKDELEEIDRHRFYLQETIEDCCRLLGGNLVLTHLGMKLRQEFELFLKTQKWQSVEACLVAMKCIAMYIPRDETVYLPYTMELVASKALLQNQNVIFVRITTSLLIGSYASWLDQHSNYLSSLLSYIAENLNSPEHTIASAASQSLKELCQGITIHQSIADPLLQLYETLIQSKSMNYTSMTFKSDLKVEIEVLEGLCIAVSRYLQSMNHVQNEPMQESITAISTRLINPIATRLTNLSNQNNTTAIRPIMAELERLTAIIRFLEIPPRPNQTEAYDSSIYLNLIQQSFPLLNLVATSFPNDADLAEKLCRLHKHSLRKVGADHYAPFLQTLMQHLLQAFDISHQSPYLYAASICITEYGNDKTYTQALFVMMSQLFSSLTKFLPDFTRVTQYPDVIEEFFYCAGRFMNYCPDPLVLDQALFGSILSFATLAMQIQHRDANRGTLNFIEHTASFGLHIQHPSEQTNEEQKLITEAYFQVIHSHGQPLIHNIALAILGELPAYSIDRGSGSIAGILWKFNYLSSDLIIQTLTATFTKYAAFLNAGSNKYTLQVQNDFLNALIHKVSRDEFSDILIKFCGVCDRQRKLQQSCN